MTLDDFAILIQAREGTILEFKERLSPAFARELAALPMLSEAGFFWVYAMTEP